MQVGGLSLPGRQSAVVGQLCGVVDRLAASLSYGPVVVPEEVALIGIDDGPLTRALARVPLNKVIQSTETIMRDGSAATPNAAWLTLHRRADSGAAGCDQCAGVQFASTVGNPLYDTGATVYPPVRLPGHQDRAGGGLYGGFIPGPVLSQGAWLQRA